MAIARQALTSLPSLRDKPLEEWPYHEHHDRVTGGWAVFSDLYEGAPDRWHGRVLAAAFDELLGCTQMMGPVMGATGALTVRYRHPSPVGTARHGEVLLAEAEGTFISAL